MGAVRLAPSAMLFGLFTLLGATQGFHIAPSTAAQRTHLRVGPSRPSPPHMGLMDGLKSFIYGEAPKKRSARNSAVSRLKVVLAHDRSGIDDITMGKIREEIQMVVAKYVVMDEQSVDFNFLPDGEGGMNVLTATFPLIRVKEQLEVQLTATAATEPAA
tara:strand:+ start:403 stop:879 length:477 start_codon:yes stop_codon:yes gene_type:complete